MKADMKNYCARCPHGKTRENCVKLCLEAEAYADQDHVGRDELPLDEFNIEFRDPRDLERTDPRESLKAKALALHGQGWSYREIAEELGISKSTISRWLK